MRKFAVLLLAALLAGCSGTFDVIQKRESLYQAAPIHPPTLRPSADAYSKALAVAQSVYGPRLDGSPATVIEAGIGAANGNCRAWMGAVSAAEQRWRQGETNVGVLSALMSGAMAAANVHRDALTIFGLGSAAWQGYSQGFLANVLGMADWDLQVKVREAMVARAAELRAQAGSMTYPAAIDAIEEYQMICTPQAAKALSRSALTAVTTTVAPSGAITSTPITSTHLKDDSGERIINFWAPANVINEANEARLLAWMKAHSVNTSIAFFSGAKLYEQARKQAVVDLNIGAAP